MSDESAAESGRIALRVAAVVLLILVVAPFVMTGVPSVVGAKESYVVLSGSMNGEPEPVIQPGDVVIVDDVNPANVEEQDIITFTTGGEEPVTHRVVNVTEQDGQVAFRTKGDANEDADPQLVGDDQIIGEVVFVIPLIGHVVNFANTTQGFVLLVLLPIGLLVLSEAWNLVMAPDELSDHEGRDGGGQSPPVDATRPTESSSSEQDSDDDSGPSTVTLQKAQAKWSALGLVPIAAATGYASFRLQTAWILTLFFASVGLCVLSGLIYLRMSWGPSGPEGSHTISSTNNPTETASVPAVTTTQMGAKDGDRRNPIVSGRIEREMADSEYIEVSVDSREELVRMAIEKRKWVVHDTETGTYVLVDDGMLFRYTEAERTDTSEPSTDCKEALGWLMSNESGSGEERKPNKSPELNGHDDTALKAVAGVPAEPNQDPDTERAEALTENPEQEQLLTDAATVSTPHVDGKESPPVGKGGDITPVVKRIDEKEPASDGAGDPSERDQRAPPRERKQGVTQAIRRIEENNATGAQADADATTRSVEGDRPLTDIYSGAKDGTSTELPGVVGTVDRLIALPIRALGFIGYLVVEPAIALYRAVLSSDQGSETERRQIGVPRRRE